MEDFFVLPKKCQCGGGEAQTGGFGEEGQIASLGVFVGFRAVEGAAAPWGQLEVVVVAVETLLGVLQSAAESIRVAVGLSRSGAGFGVKNKGDRVTG